MWKYYRMMLWATDLLLVMWGSLSWVLPWALCNDYEIKFTKGKKSHKVSGGDMTRHGAWDI